MLMMVAFLTNASAGTGVMTLNELSNGASVSGSFLNFNGNTMLVDNCHNGEMILLYQQDNSEAMLYSSLEQGVRFKKTSQGGIYQTTRMGVLTSNNTERVVKGNTGFFTTLDNLMGEHVWTRNILPVFVDDSANVVLGYRAKWNSFNNDIEFHAQNILYAYRLSDGHTLWSDTISHYTRWGWNQVKYIPETGNYLVWADKLYIIDPQTGVKKSMTLNTGRYGVPIGLSKKDHSTNHNSDADYAFSPYVDRGYYTGLKSNVIFQNGNIYLADEEDLYCMDLNLNVKWYTQLPKDNTSAMKIRIDNDRITLMSSGLAYLEGCSYEEGKAFIAQFDLANGSQKSLKYINLDGKILDAYLGNGKAFYLTNNGLCEVNDFSNPTVTTYDKDVIGKAVEISNHSKYALDGKRMLTMTSDDNNVLLADKNGNVTLFNGDENKVTKKVAEDELYDKKANGIYTCMSLDKNGQLSGDPSSLVLANVDGSVKAHFSTHFSGAFYADGQLTIVMDKGVFTTKL